METTSTTQRRVSLPVISAAPKKSQEDLDFEAELRAFEDAQRAELGLAGQKTHWTDAVPRTFTAEQRTHTTMLVGGLTIAHDYIITGALEGLEERDGVGEEGDTAPDPLVHVGELGELGDGPALVGGEALLDVGRDGLEQRLLGGEVAVHGAHRHAGTLGHEGDRDGGGRLLDHELAERAEDAVGRLLGLGLAAGVVVAAA